MQRPTRLFCYRLGRELHKDVDEILAWPLSKLKEYMAFYVTENSDWQKEYQESQITPEDKHKMFASIIGSD